MWQCFRSQAAEYNRNVDWCQPTPQAHRDVIPPPFCLTPCQNVLHGINDRERQQCCLYALAHPAYLSFISDCHHY
jgi:hypothetical protein